MKLKLVDKRDEAKGTKSFFWEPENPVNWIAGQYYYLTIPVMKYPDPKGNTRHFTISSSPTEGNLIRLTTRIREDSGYKRTLDELPLGAETVGEGPNGTFVLDETAGKGPNIFLAGGIGITPFRSIIKYVADKKLPVPIYLIYSNSDNDFTFGTELKEIDRLNESINIEFYDSSKMGHLDDLKIGELIGKWKIENGKLVTWWVCGPPAMIDAMETVLGKMGITSDHIRSEKFTGY